MDELTRESASHKLRREWQVWNLKRRNI